MSEHMGLSANCVTEAAYSEYTRSLYTESGNTITRSGRILRLVNSQRAFDVFCVFL